MNKMDRLPRVLRGAPPRADGTSEGVDYSQLIDFHRCRYRWHLKNRRRIERRGFIRAPDLGSAVHAGFGAGLAVLHFPVHLKPSKSRTKTIYREAERGIIRWAQEFKQARNNQLNEDELQALSTTVAEALVITERSIEFFNPDRWRVITLGKKPLVEQKIFWPIPLAKIPFYGTPDLVAEDLEEGGIWVHDYKVRERFLSAEDENFDLQLPTYQYGLLQQKPYIQTVGAIKWQFRSQVPQTPSVNKNGSMSRQRIATSWDHYKAELVKNKLDPAEYEIEMKQKLDVEFFRMHPILRSNFLVQQIWNEITLPLTQVYLQAKKFPRVMHTWGCSGCWAREFCAAELRAEDTDFLLATSFVDQTNPQPRMMLRPEDIEVV